MSEGAEEGEEGEGEQGSGVLDVSAAEKHLTADDYIWLASYK